MVLHYYVIFFIHSCISQKVHVLYLYSIKKRLLAFKIEGGMPSYVILVFFYKKCKQSKKFAAKMMHFEQNIVGITL